MTERHPGEVAMVTKGADDDFGLSRALQHTYMFTQVCRNQDEHSGTVHNHNFIPGQFVNASYDVSGCIKVWSPPKRRFKAAVVLSRKIDTACKSRVRRCIQTFGRKPHCWMRIPV